MRARFLQGGVFFFASIFYFVVFSSPLLAAQNCQGTCITNVSASWQNSVGCNNSFPLRRDAETCQTGYHCCVTSTTPATPTPSPTPAPTPTPSLTPAPTPAAGSCESGGGRCISVACSGTETQTTDTCSGRSNHCCKPKGTTPPTTTPGSCTGGACKISGCDSAKETSAGACTIGGTCCMPKTTNPDDPGGTGGGPSASITL